MGPDVSLQNARYARGSICCLLACKASVIPSIAKWESLDPLIFSIVSGLQKTSRLE